MTEPEHSEETTRDPAPPEQRGEGAARVDMHQLATLAGWLAAKGAGKTEDHKAYREFAGTVKQAYLALHRASEPTGEPEARADLYNAGYAAAVADAKANWPAWEKRYAPATSEPTGVGEREARGRVFDRDKHHASCDPEDSSLMWHCDQCGLDEPASPDEQGREALARADELAEIAEAIGKGADWFDSLTGAVESYRSARAALPDDPAPSVDPEDVEQLRRMLRRRWQLSTREAETLTRVLAALSSNASQEGE